MATETEFKFLLSQAAFTKLSQALAPRKISNASQRNVYFDTASALLRRRRMALRLREAGGKRTLTVKKDLKTKGYAGLSHRLEYECSVPRSFEKQLEQKNLGTLQTFAPIRHLVELVPSSDGLRFRKTAEMKTRRSAYRLRPGAILELDEVTLPGGKVFFEAELETHHPGSARKLLLQLFQQHGVKARPVKRTKLARAMSEARRRSARR